MVDTEFKKNLSSQDKQIYQLIKSVVVDKDCRANRFGTGNAESLQADDICKRVKQFYEEHYSANLMNVCIVSNHSCDSLEQMAKDSFGNIINKNKEV